jgi:protein SMG6
MTTLHPFPMSRESVLQIWSAPAQARRALPDSHVPDLFVLLHGMLFTNIQLDDFKPVLARFMERLNLEGAEERDWVMMAVTNIAALLEYGKQKGVLRCTGGIGGKDNSSAAQAAAANVKVNMLTKKVDEMEVDDAEDGASALRQERDASIKGSGVLTVSPQYQNASPVTLDESDLPLAFKFALQLTFEMFAFTLRNPTRKATSFSRPSLNPYNTILLTFLATVMKHTSVQRLLERAVPWDALAQFFSSMPSSGLNPLLQADSGIRLTSGCSPLPEDWCLRGMEWGGRRVYERGFWKNGEGRHAEMEVLDTIEIKDGQTDGIIEDESEAEGRAEGSETSKRWIRIARSAGIISKMIPGFSLNTSSRSFVISGILEEKLQKWKEEDRLEREDEERRRSRRPWLGEDMDVDDEEDAADGLSDDFDSDEDESEEVKALKVRTSFYSNYIHLLMKTIILGETPRASSYASIIHISAEDSFAPTPEACCDVATVPVIAPCCWVHYLGGGHEHPLVVIVLDRFAC